MFENAKTKSYLDKSSIIVIDFSPVALLLPLLISKSESSSSVEQCKFSSVFLLDGCNFGDNDHSCYFVIDDTPILTVLHPHQSTKKNVESSPMGLLEVHLITVQGLIMSNRSS